MAIASMAWRRMRAAALAGCAKGIQEPICLPPDGGKPADDHNMLDPRFALLKKQGALAHIDLLKIISA
jgi:hypothetical protein